MARKKDDFAIALSGREMTVPEFVEHYERVASAAATLLKALALGQFPKHEQIRELAEAIDWRLE